jgi:hypothetical protein
MRNGSVGLLALIFPMAALAQLSILPVSQSVANAGNSATYVLMLVNSTGASQTFVPSVVSGVTSAWGVQLPASVTVAPGGTQTFNLVLTTPVNLAGGSYPFTMSVTTAASLTFTASATLVVGAGAGSPPPGTPAPPSIILICTGLIFAGLYAARHRLGLGISRL